MYADGDNVANTFDVSLPFELKLVDFEMADGALAFQPTGLVTLRDTVR